MVEEAKRHRAKISPPNAFITIPATVEGLPAITTAVAGGISINVTLVFSLDRCRDRSDEHPVRRVCCRLPGAQSGSSPLTRAFCVRIE